MRANRIIAGLIVVLFGALPLLAAGPAPEASPAEPPAPWVETPGVTPDPTLLYGVKYGPCTVSVTCIDDTFLQCGGMNVCYWKLDSWNNRGFVECDGQRHVCPPL